VTTGWPAIWTSVSEPAIMSSTKTIWYGFPAARRLVRAEGKPDTVHQLTRDADAVAPELLNVKACGVLVEVESELREDQQVLQRHNRTLTV
jgi:hypothetical protein